MTPNNANPITAVTGGGGNVVGAGAGPTMATQAPATPPTGNAAFLELARRKKAHAAARAHKRHIQRHHQRHCSQPTQYALELERERRRNA